MAGFITKRFAQAIVLIKCILIFVFPLPHLSGDPARMMAPGAASKEGEEAGLPTPCNDAVAEIAREVNEGQLKVGRSDFGRPKARAATRPA